MPNKISQFWQELKRRNVTRVLAVYIAAAFMILELISMFSEQIGLPDGTWKVAFFISLAGLVLAFIISWIYDVHPEGGMVKTEPADKVKSEDIIKSSSSWKIASYISFVVIVGLIVLNVIPRSGKKEILDKSIAVLPFRNDSPEQTEMYFIDGTMESILDNLCKIKDLRVVSRTSVEQYRNNPKPIPTVGEEMNVSYMVEGSGLRHGDNIRLTIQLIDAVHDQHIWSNTYNRKAEEIFELQSEIAQLVAEEIEAVITPEEIQRIENIPTTNLTAHDFYLRGRGEHFKYFLDQQNLAPLYNAITFYKRAIELDPEYAQAYTSLALAYSTSFFTERNRNKEFSVRESEVYRDSILTLVNNAVSINKDLEEAYLVRCNYYWGIQEYDKAIKEIDRAIEINPNYAYAYDTKANFLFYQHGKWVEAIENKLKAISLERGELKPVLLRELGWFYEDMGFNDKAIELYEQVFQLTQDTIMYYEYMAGTGYSDRNWEEHIKYCIKIIEMDPNRYWPYSQLPLAYWNIGNYDSSNYYAMKLNDFGESKLTYAGDFEITVGNYYWNIGKKEEAIELLDKAENYLEYRNDSNEGDHFFNLGGLAHISYIKEDYEEAIMLLEQIDLSTVKQQWFIIWLEMPYTFEDLHPDQRFQRILNTMKSTWQTEHERVRQWLEENDML